MKIQNLDMECVLSVLARPKGLKERIAEKETQMRNYRGIPIGGKEFVYGWYCEIMSKHYIIPDIAIRRTYKWQDSDKIEFTFFDEVIPETAGQQVGLKDKSGKKEKEVYQGDVITYQHPVSLMEWTAIVIWNEKWFQWALQDKGTKDISPLIILEGYHWKIIGNIHTTPKLWEQDNA